MGGAIGVGGIVDIELWYFEDRLVKCDSEMSKIPILLIFKKSYYFVLMSKQAVGVPGRYS